MTRKSKTDKPVKTTRVFNFNGNMLGNKVLTKEEKEKILRPLNKYEYEGEGLPLKTLKEGEHPFSDLTFTIRIFHDQEGNLELATYLKGTKRYRLIPFEGLNENQACNAKGTFGKNIIRIIESTCFTLANAAYEKQKGGFEQKKEMLDTIVKNTSNEYKAILELGHEKIIEQTEGNGIKTVKTIFIDVGAKPQSEKELEKEKRKFIDEIYSAFVKFKRNHIRTPNQKDLMPYLFKGYKDKEKKISTMMKKHRFKFRQMWFVFNATDNINDFVNNIILTIRVTDK